PDSLIPKFTEVALPFTHRFDKDKSLPSLGSSIIDVDGDGIDEVFIGGGIEQKDALFVFKGNKFEPWAGKLPEKHGATLGAVSYDWDRDG
ncbi:FG-GAP repeat domain-containing protein, partial [Acinetobacter baumannii]|uniref:FG-GAP repeat domain-containing protein n=1 Tax=Acinetobacter baumannii TaxID=470 RepID=UPI003991F8FC